MEVLGGIHEALAACFAAVDRVTGVSLAQQAVPTINFESVSNPLKLPTNMYFGEVSGVAVNSKGHVFVLSRGNTTRPGLRRRRHAAARIRRNGKFIREIGKNLYAWSFAHTVKVDPRTISG